MEVTKRRAQKQKAAKAFWGDIRRRVKEYILKEAPHADATTRMVWERLATDELRALSETIQWRIRNSTHSLSTYAPTRRALSAACRTLLMDPPAPGKLPDLKEAAKKKRVLAREYHPDTAGGGDRDRFEAVVAAYDTIERAVTATTKTEEESDAD